jgi:formate hydrogenlyase subunit 3/multisubunit Na+/H+ antiporter MnhD subunit
MLHSTLVTGALFLIADLIGRQRGIAMDEMVRARPVNQATLLSVFFFAFAIAAIGLPPLSGFVGKALLLQSASRLAEQVWVWPALLISSLMALVAFTKGGQYVLLARFPKRRVRRPERAVDPNGFPIHFAVGNRIDDRFCRFDFGIQPGGRQRYSQAPDHHTTAEPDRQEPNP